MSDYVQEIFLPWVPCSESLVDRVVDRIVDSDDGLTIILRGKTKASVDTGKVLNVRFDPYLVYRVMDESYRGRTWQKNIGSEIWAQRLRPHRHWRARGRARILGQPR